MSSDSTRTAAGEKPGRNWADLGPRLISAAVLLAITAATLVIGGIFFAIVVGVVFAGCYREWETMVARRKLDVSGMIQIALVAFSGLAFHWFGPLGTYATSAVAAGIAIGHGGEGASWRVGGHLFLATVIVAVLAMRGGDATGIAVGVYLGTVVWMTDSAAFFSGRLLGGPKLAPIISPSKTWSGSLGGLALGTLAGTLVWVFITPTPFWIGLLFSAGLSVLGQIGDLTESRIKRFWRIKDSGDIIPGHGGLMDRLDSLTFAVIALFIVGWLHGGFDMVASGFLHW